MDLTLPNLTPSVARLIAKSLRNEADRIRGYKSGAGATELDAAADAIERQIREAEQRVEPFRGERAKAGDLRPGPRDVTGKRKPPV